MIGLRRELLREGICGGRELPLELELELAPSDCIVPVRVSCRVCRVSCVLLSTHANDASVSLVRVTWLRWCDRVHYPIGRVSKCRPDSQELDVAQTIDFGQN